MRRRSDVLRQAFLLVSLMVLVGLHSRPRPRVNAPHTGGGNGSRSKGGGSDTDTRRRRSGDGAEPARRSKHAAGSTVRAKQQSLRNAATGTTARPKTPGAPRRTDRLPPGRTRKDARGRDITLDPDRAKRKPKFTSGFNEDLPAPTFDPKTKRWTINVRMHEGWDGSDFEAKANHLKNLGEEGKLTKTPDTADLRDKAKTDQWRADRERELFYDAKDQADLDAKLSALDGQQVDHAQELQLGGRDSPDNMWGIDAATNHGMGGQIKQQLGQVPDGATIEVNVIHDKYSPKR